MDPRTITILELRAENLAYAQIAARLGISPSRVGELVRQAERQSLLADVRGKA